MSGGSAQPGRTGHPRLLATGGLYPKGPALPLLTKSVVRCRRRPPAPVSLQVTLFLRAPVSRLSGSRSPGLSCPELEAGLSL